MSAGQASWWKVLAATVVVLAWASFSGSAWGAEIQNVTAVQRWPWNGKVDIEFEVVGELPTNAVLVVSAEDGASGTNYLAATNALAGDTGTDEGAHHVVWDLDEQGEDIQSTNVVFSVAYDWPLYCVVDLSGGTNAVSYPVTYMDAPPSGGFNTDAYKTTKLVLRRIEPGTFMMGGNTETTLTKPYYVGVFEVTQKQWELVTGSNPSDYEGDARPVEYVSYNMIRGSSAGAGWPGSDAVDADSFLGKLRARTGVEFDLPTEAQWEYACRAGTTTDLNSGKNLTNWDQDSAMDEVGRYYHNRSDGKSGYSQHTTVGSYLPNAWGLYDMHGNVCEWCLDWPGTLGGGTDPEGSSSGSSRVRRGGSWDLNAHYCTSSYRGSYGYPSLAYNDRGFRLARTLSK